MTGVLQRRPKTDPFPAVCDKRRGRFGETWGVEKARGTWARGEQVACHRIGSAILEKGGIVGVATCPWRCPRTGRDEEIIAREAPYLHRGQRALPATVDGRGASGQRRDDAGLPSAAQCYPFSMKPSRPRRAGAKRTFSVSVDAETKRALRALAEEEFGGNRSALVTDFAEEARRRMAAGEYLRKHRIPKLVQHEADTLQAAIDREIETARRRRKRRVA